MGALIIEKNDLKDALPSAAHRIALAVAEAVKPHRGAFFGSVFAQGQAVHVRLRECTNAARAWQREVRVPLATAEVEVKRRVEHLLEIRRYVTQCQVEGGAAALGEEPSAWPQLR